MLHKFPLKTVTAVIRYKITWKKKKKIMKTDEEEKSQCTWKFRLKLCFIIYKITFTHNSVSVTWQILHRYKHALMLNYSIALIKRNTVHLKIFPYFTPRLKSYVNTSHLISKPSFVIWNELQILPYLLQLQRHAYDQKHVFGKQDVDQDKQERAAAPFCGWDSVPCSRSDTHSDVLLLWLKGQNRMNRPHNIAHSVS